MHLCSLLLSFFGPSRISHLRLAPIFAKASKCRLTASGLRINQFLQLKGLLNLSEVVNSRPLSRGQRLFPLELSKRKQALVGLGRVPHEDFRELDTTSVLGAAYFGRFNFFFSRILNQAFNGFA